VKSPIFFPLYKWTTIKSLE